jgi:hypothetical protein
MSDIFSAGASIASAAMQAKAVKDATKMQVEALERQRNFVFKNLDPNVLQAAATSADVTRTQQRLALQATTDPALSQLRFASQQKLLEQGLAAGGGPGDLLAEQLFEEAAGPEDQRQKVLRDKILDAALEEIDAGATLPPDVQAELVRAGLERSGTVGTGASSRGLAGELTRKLIGNEAVALKRARQDQAVRLGLAANEMSNQRLGILSSVFPQLKSLETQNIATQKELLSTANQLTPEAGLGGTDIANVFLARVGATNQIAQSVADANARQALDTAAAWQGALGTIGQTASGIAKDAGLGSTGSILGSLFKPKGGGGGGDVASTGFGGMFGG